METPLDALEKVRCTSFPRLLAAMMAYNHAKKEEACHVNHTEYHSWGATGREGILLAQSPKHASLSQTNVT